MLNLREIFRPKTIDEALHLLARPDTAALAGGTELIASRRRDVRAVVDLNNLGLAYIRDQNGAVAIGATTTLANIAESPMLRAVANGVVALAAHRTASSLLRNQATLVGTLIAEPTGILATALVAMEVTLALVPSPPEKDGTVKVTDFLARRRELLEGALVTKVVIPTWVLTRRAALETVARTPGDKAIVAICASVELGDGVVRSAAIAMGGVGETAVRAAGTERMLLGQPLSDEVIVSLTPEAMERIVPLSDYRGSAEYRREIARVLMARALRAID
jgi:CO/xanthine dehydrogenase FAD-binding subunit